MKTKKNWLFKDARNIIFVLGASFFVKSLFMILFNYLRIDNFILFVRQTDEEWQYSCIIAPLIEEFLFRWLPITFFILAFGKKFDSLKWYLAALLSIAFGLAHGGYFRIFINGVGGFFYCYLYFKNRYRYVSGVIAHSAWNFTLGFILPWVS